MRQMNQQISPELLNSKQEYLKKSTGLNPLDNSSEITHNWEEFSDSLKTHPHLHDHDFIDYPTWRQSHPNDLIENLYNEHKPGELIKEFESSGETDFERFKAQKLERKAREIYNIEKDLNKSKLFDLNSDETNPFKGFNDIRKKWANQVAEYHKENIPFGDKNGNQKVTLFIGYPGAGKSTYIDPEPSDESIKNTKYGILIDPDEFQKDLMGFHNGMGSQNTLVYAISIVKPEIIKTALERGNDIVIPLVGGSPDAILNEAVNFITQGYSVDVVIVPTDLSLSYQRLMNRSTEPSSRLISPISAGNPIEAFKTTQDILNQPDLITPDIFTKKLLNKLGLTPAQQKNMPPEEKGEIRNQYKNKIEFHSV